MIDLPIVNIALSLIMLYLLLSVVCSTIKEMISRLFALRFKTLTQALERLVTDDNIREQVMQQPLIKALGDQPSYIPSKTFAMALLDVAAQQSKVAQSKAAQASASDGDNADAAKTTPAKPTFESIRNDFEQLPEGDLRNALLTLTNNVEEDVTELRDSVETWFNNTMDRATGWYKRKAQAIVMSIALVVTGLTNADTLHMAHSLSEDTALRQSLVAAAEGYAASANPTNGFDDVYERIEEIDLPLGWKQDELPQNFYQWVLKILGLTLTFFALSLGAPFWFDLLNRVVSLRSSGHAPSSTPTAGS